MSTERPSPKLQVVDSSHEPLAFEQALETVKQKLTAPRYSPPSETLPLDLARGRILAEDVQADRDYPPFHRSMRDGFAVRAADAVSTPSVLQCVGEIAAGGHYDKTVGAGTCVQIMTGAPLPAGADAVVMIENTTTNGSKVNILRSVRTFENVVNQASEARKGSIVLRRGRRLYSGEIGLLASVGVSQAPVFRQPRIAVLTTGDEVVPVEQPPEWYQVRNSNSSSLASQVAEAGGIPRVLGVAPDSLATLTQMIERSLEDDLLVISGGVSAGKYDLVEQALADLGGEFYFRSVALRPGKPLVFGRVRGLSFFGLPGNPISSYVTFELFVRRAIGVLAGGGFEEPVFLGALLAKPVLPRKGLTAFLPACVAMKESLPVVGPVNWQGSGDLVGFSASNCFLVLKPDEAEPQAGDWVQVMLKGWNY